MNARHKALQALLVGMLIGLGLTPMSWAGDCVEGWDMTYGQAGLSGAQVKAFAEYNGEIIAGGSFTGSSNVARRWDGSAWQPLGNNFSDPGGAPTVLDLAPYNGELFAGGQFTSAGGQSADHIARWNGTTWQPVGGGVTGGPNPRVSALTVWNGLLVVAGRFSLAGGQPASNVAVWDGSEWQALGSGVDGPVLALGTYNGDLIVGGEFSVAGGQLAKCIARWDGVQWHGLGSGVDDTDWAVVMDAVTYNGDLIAVGWFSSIDGVPAEKIARWNGTQWSPMGSGLNGLAYVAIVHNNLLYVGGNFTIAGGAPAIRVARWNGSAWQMQATGPNAAVEGIIAVQEEVVFGGFFWEVNGQSCDAVASLRSSGAPPAITDSPPSVLAATGDTVVFAAAGDGPGTLIYQWRKDGVDLTDGGNISGANTTTLTISKVSLADFGAYDVRISNPCGAAVSNPAALGILPPSNNCPADLNGSGAVDVQDLLILLGAWGMCPK